ncbi:unnamed protein product [Absidia cylindrospora]
MTDGRIDSPVDQAPPWAQALLQRLETLEASIQQSSSPHPFDNDPHVTVRAPGADFTPPQEVLDLLPSMTGDFFRSPLDDNDRRRFLFECPKNSLRNYTPPEPMRVATSSVAKATDQQLYDLQYRISGLTRPLDWFLHKVATGQYHDKETLQDYTLDFISSTHALLADLASHITDLRTANLYKAAQIQARPPSLTQSSNPLVDSKSFVEHLQLEDSVQKAISKNQRPRSRPTNKTQTTSTPPPKPSTPSYPSAQDKSKSYDKGPQQPKQQSSGSSDFRQSSHHKPRT